MKKSYLFLADGFEEIEALATVDILRRAGMDLATISINPTPEVTGAHGITVTADLLFGQADFHGSEWLILPGGMPGATNLYQFTPLQHLLTAHKGKIAAICASPAVVLAPLGILKGKKATCYPSFEAPIIENGATHTETPVVNLGDIITANGPAAAVDFALAIVANSLGSEIARQVADGMLWNK